MGFENQFRKYLKTLSSIQEARIDHLADKCDVDGDIWKKTAVETVEDLTDESLKFRVSFAQDHFDIYENLNGKGSGKDIQKLIDRSFVRRLLEDIQQASDSEIRVAAKAVQLWISMRRLDGDSAFNSGKVGRELRKLRKQSADDCFRFIVDEMLKIDPKAGKSLALDLITPSKLIELQLRFLGDILIVPDERRSDSEGLSFRFRSDEKLKTKSIGSLQSLITRQRKK